MGFRCRALGDDMLRVWSPFTYGNDGERIGFYVEQTPNGYVVTDNCEALMHADCMGINLTKGRMESLRNVTHFEPGLISERGELVKFVSADRLADGMVSVLNAAIAVSHFERQWRPRRKQESFVNEVATVLEEKFGGRVERKVTAIGASGHQLELPLGIRFDDQLTFIQPIAADENEAVDWKNVYASFGRMSDLRNADSGIGRLIVLEDAANDEEMRKAVSLLSTAAPVVYFKNLPQWAAQKAA
jgi:hypothetical protein